MEYPNDKIRIGLLESMSITLKESAERARKDYYEAKRPQLEGYAKGQFVLAKILLANYYDIHIEELSDKI